MRFIRKYFVLILVLALIYTSGLLIATVYKLQGSQSDLRLIELQQLKLEQIEQVDALLIDIRTEIQNIELELDQPVEMKALRNLTAEEIAASLRRPGLEAKLTQLKEQEAEFLSRKLYLEEDLEGINALLSE